MPGASWPAASIRSHITGARSSAISVDAPLPRLIFRLVRFGGPLLKRLSGVFVRNVKHRDAALGVWERDLPVDEGIVEPRSGRILVCGGEKDALRPRPVDRSQTHGTGLARC